MLSFTKNIAFLLIYLVQNLPEHFSLFKVFLLQLIPIFLNIEICDIVLFQKITQRGYIIVIIPSNCTKQYFFDLSSDLLISTALLFLFLQ